MNPLNTLLLGLLVDDYCALDNWIIFFKTSSHRSDEGEIDLVPHRPTQTSSYPRDVGLRTALNRGGTLISYGVEQWFAEGRGLGRYFLTKTPPTCVYVLLFLTTTLSE